MPARRAYRGGLSRAPSARALVAPARYPRTVRPMGRNRGCGNPSLCGVFDKEKTHGLDKQIYFKTSWRVVWLVGSVGQLQNPNSDFGSAGRSVGRSMLGRSVGRSVGRSMVGRSSGRGR